MVDELVKIYPPEGYIIDKYHDYFLLAFKSYNIAASFANNFQDLLETAKPLL